MGFDRVQPHFNNLVGVVLEPRQKQRTGAAGLGRPGFGSEHAASNLARFFLLSTPSYYLIRPQGSTELSTSTWPQHRAAGRSYKNALQLLTPNANADP